MRISHKAPGTPRTVGILAAAFNPPTLAHLALAQSALTVVEEVVLALPSRLPHKDFSGATLEQRIEMLHCVVEARDRLSAGVAEGGLFAEIAREAREHYPNAAIYLICGRDAADRILGWDYGEPGFVEQMLREFSLLVAPRDGSYTPPLQYRHAIRELPLPNFDECSSTRARAGEWTLVPAEIVEQVQRIYLG